MKFKFLIIDLSEGSVSGTNEEIVAKEFAQSDDYYVVNTETGIWMMDESNSKEIKEQDTYQLSNGNPVLRDDLPSASLDDV